MRTSYITNFEGWPLRRFIQSFTSRPGDYSNLASKEGKYTMKMKKKRASVNTT